MTNRIIHSTQDLPNFRISTLVFIKNQAGELLLIKRVKAPNKGKWSPIGGKLETGTGESPFECAIRETKEEVGLEVEEKDLHLFACISEKNYENAGHWLMFLFTCKKALVSLPPEGVEGKFGFFKRDSINESRIPPSDKALVWPIFDEFGDAGFVALRVDCADAENLVITTEERIESPR